MRLNRVWPSLRRLPLREQVEAVVRRDNCSGCGACASISPSIAMAIDGEGYLRPRWTGTAGEGDSRRARALFPQVCPGAVLVRPRTPAGTQVHPVLGPYLSVWRAWAVDPEVRWRGSSGGVLTALSGWLLENGAASSVVGAAMSPSTPTRTVPVRIRSRSEVASMAGSRYAPVGNASLFDPHVSGSVFVGKPCEVSAAGQLQRATPEAGAGPIRLSFFCAGTPSQAATEKLIAVLGVEPTAQVHYRGRGWPGTFLVQDAAGRSAEVSYEDSWGRHLGPTVQPRCKICPDGTGGDADIAVGDYWRADAAGFPLFTESAGESVAIARTPRGDELLRRAEREGVVTLEPVDPIDVAAVQPLQTRRQRDLPGRLLGRLLAGRPVPRMRGFAMLRTFGRHPRANLVAARGAFARARRR